MFEAPEDGVSNDKGRGASAAFRFQPSIRTDTMPLRRPVAAIAAIIFRDPARPVEWISLLALAGWAQFLFETPQVLLRDSYTAFRALPAWAWAAIMASVVIVQLAAMLPVTRGREWLRFLAMALAAGLWTIVAINFWLGDAITTGARTYSALALMTSLTGVWLGWTRSSPN